MKRDTIETLLWIFCIIMLLIVTIKVDREGQSYSCDQCTVTLKNKIAYEDYQEFGTFKVYNLYLNYYVKGYCTIKWSPTQGYYLNNEVK